MSNKEEYNKFYVNSLIITTCIGAFYFGYQLAVLAVFGDNFQPVGINISNNQVNLLLSVLPFAAGIGAMFAGPLAKRGRRKALIFVDMIALLGPILENSQTYYSFFAGRFICGVAVGFNSAIVPLFVNEISPSSQKGFYGNFFQNFLCVGLLIGYVIGLGPYNTTSYWWRVLITLPGILSGLRTVMYLTCFKYETPLFSVSEKNIEEAKKMLECIYNREDAETELKRLEYKVLEDSKRGKIGYKHMVSNKYFRRLLLSCTLMMIQQLSGINAICLSATVILGGSQAASCMVGVAELAGGFVSLGLINKYGRKTLLITGAFFCAAFCFLFAISTNLPQIVQVIFLMLYLISYGFSLGPVIWMYSPEIIPDVGVSIATMVNWFSAAAVVQIFGFTKKFGDPVNFVGFGVLCILGALYAMIFMKETKGKTATEIEDMFPCPENAKGLLEGDSVVPV